MNKTILNPLKMEERIYFDINSHCLLIVVVYTVKSKVYSYLPKNWVMLPVIHMTQSVGYNSPLVAILVQSNH